VLVHSVDHVEVVELVSWLDAEQCQVFEVVAVRLGHVAPEVCAEHIKHDPASTNMQRLR